MLQYVAVYCNVLQCAAVSDVCVAECCSILQYLAVYCNVLQCVAVSQVCGLATRLAGNAL